MKCSDRSTTTSLAELGESSRTDTIFVLTAIVFNLIVLGVNSGISTAAIEERDATTTYDLLLAVFIALTVLVNAIAVAALTLGRRTRSMLLGGLVAMYRDNEVDKYYDPPSCRTTAYAISSSQG